MTLLEQRYRQWRYFFFDCWITATRWMAWKYVEAGEISLVWGSTALTAQSDVGENERNNCKLRISRSREGNSQLRGVNRNNKKSANRRRKIPLRNHYFDPFRSWERSSRGEKKSLLKLSLRISATFMDWQGGKKTVPTNCSVSHATFATIHACRLTRCMYVANRGWKKSVRRPDPRRRPKYKTQSCNIRS